MGFGAFKGKIKSFSSIVLVIQITSSLSGAGSGDTFCIYCEMFYDNIAGHHSYLDAHMSDK